MSSYGVWGEGLCTLVWSRAACVSVGILILGEARIFCWWLDLWLTRFCHNLCGVDNVFHGGANEPWRCCLLTCLWCDGVWLREWCRFADLRAFQLQLHVEGNELEFKGAQPLPTGAMDLKSPWCA